MRRAISTILGLSLASSAMPAALAPVTVAAAQPAGRPAGQGFCRRPGPLPDPGPEQGQQRPRREMRAEVLPSPVPVASIAASGDAEAADVVVAARSVDGAPPPSAPPPPPAPPPAALAVDAAPVAAMPVPGSAERAGLVPAPPPRSRPQPQPQGGLLTAGEHDDLLNPELYADYVRRSQLGQQVQALPVLDTARLLTVEVRDARGRPAPFVPVELRCADGNGLTFTTQADGTVAFFPGMDRLSTTVRIRAGKGEWREVNVPRSVGTGRVGFTLAGAAQPVTRLDLALVVDVTGSMSDELGFLQTELDAIVAGLNRRHPGLDIRVGMTFYRDQGDDFVTRSFGFTGDIARARAQLGQQAAGGGGDYEEAMQDALVRAARLDWRSDAIKTLLLVADAPPHARDVPRAWLAAEHLRAQRVQIVPVGASGVGDLAEYVMRAMAAATQSRYAFLTDDSGIGNPHAPPAIDCYLVTRLDRLLSRIIDSQVSGRRIEPDEQEVIRAVGQYDRGRCVLPPDWRGQA